MTAGGVNRPVVSFTGKLPWSLQRVVLHPAAPGGH